MLASVITTGVNYTTEGAELAASLKETTDQTASIKEKFDDILAKQGAIDADIQKSFTDSINETSKLTAQNATLTRIFQAKLKRSQLLGFIAVLAVGILLLLKHFKVI